MIIPSTTTANLLVNSLTSVGLAIPKDAAAWLLLRQNLEASLERPTEDIQEAVEAVKLEGVEPVVDRLVRERVEATTRKQVTNDLIEAAAGYAVRLIRAKSDDLIRKARPAFDKAAATVHEHAQVYSPDQQAASVLDAGPASGAAWTAIRDASATLDEYATMRAHLYGVPTSADAVVASYDGDWWMRVDASQDFDTRERWHRLARRGLTLKLNTHAEATALEANTPERALRTETSYEGGVTMHAQVR